MFYLHAEQEVMISMVHTKNRYIFLYDNQATKS